MKLQFEHNLDYQLAAIDAVCDLFSGQEVCRTEFTVTAPRSVYLGEGTQGALPGMAGDGVQLGLGLAESDLGIGNRLQLDSQDLLANLNKVQLRHGDVYKRQMSAYPAMGDGPNQWSPRELKLATALVGKNRHYEAEHIQRRHFNSSARRLGFGEDAEALLQDFIARTPAVVEQVQREVPAGFSQLVLIPMGVQDEPICGML